MREQFPEFYSPEGNEFKKLWSDGIFVLDTSVLLSLYRYPPKTQIKLFGALKKLKKRLWIPHQVALEFYRKRLSVICAQEKTYSDMLNGLSVFEDQSEKHPFLYDKKRLKSLKKSFDSIRSELKEIEKSRPKWLLEDKVLSNIEKLIGDKVGKPYSADRMKQVLAEGSERYEKDIPPGYKDADKDKSDKSKTRKYGDLIIWYQIIDKAKEEKKPIILVTEERKDDWWWKEDGGRNIGVRFELKKEILDKAGVTLHMYQSDQFIEHSQEHLDTKFTSAFITEIKEAREKFGEEELESASSSSSSSLIPDGNDASNVLGEIAQASDVNPQESGGDSVSL